MSERKVLNKYYPPDFDPSKIPKLRLAKERQYTVRIMAPFNMQCKVCGEYIYKGKKFNAKTENVHNENYLGLRIYRFYIRCPKCISEIVFKTDPETTDYTLEVGGTRLFEAVKLLQKAEEAEKRQADEDAQNPMKVLENRTKDSKLEMEVMENLEELRELNMRQAAINYEEILRQGAEKQAQELLKQEEEDEAEIRRIFGKTGDIVIKRLEDEDDEQESVAQPSPSLSSTKRPTDVLTDESDSPSSAPKKQKLAGSSSKTSSKSFLSSLVKVNKNTSGKISDNKPGSASSPSTSTLTAAGENTDTAATPTNLSSQTSGPREDAAMESNKAKSDASSSSSDNTSDRLTQDGTKQGDDNEEETFMSHIQEGLVKQRVASQKVDKEKSSGLSLLGGYDFSDSDLSDSSSDT